MRFSTLPRRTRIILLIAAALAVAVVAIALFGLLRGPATREPAPTDPPSPTQPAAPETIAPSSQPVTFAARVASALFDWDTIGSTPEQITDAVMGVAEPGGEDVPGLYADIARYLPTAAQWAQLREYDTSQRLEIEDAFVPESWRTLAATGADGLPEEAVAVTIDGTRVRTGVWLGETTELRSPVVFTVFLLCDPDENHGCVALRLSEPGRSLR